ncbi:MAG: sigma-70 family RNA polymerase sigma factor [Candidatus Acidiferrum sp.]
MQDALPALVLNSEALARHAMNDTPANPATTDEQLMLAFTLGSSDAFTELFRRYKQPIYAFFRRRVTDPAHAEEFTQETFLALLKAASRYQPRALFRTYLYSIGFKILRAHRRKTIFRAMFSAHPSTIPDPAKHDATESGLWVRRAVEKLDPIDREVLLLREFEQLSYTEIADLLQLPLNTVRSRLFRARTALRDLLEPPASAVAESSTPNSLERATQNPAPAAAPIIHSKRNPA